LSPVGDGQRPVSVQWIRSATRSQSFSPMASMPEKSWNRPRQDPSKIVRRCDLAIGFQVRPKRWFVERNLAWITANRRMARHFERYAETAKAIIHIAMIKLMTRRLARFVNS
jgi:transposase